MSSALRDKIRDAEDIEAEPYPIPEWGVELELRSYTLDRRSMFQAAMMKAGDEGTLADVYPAMIIAACFDPETGEPVFSDEDAAMLRTKSGAVAERLTDRISKMNRLVPEAVEEGKDDSSGTPSDGSGSSSPPDSE